MRGLNKFSGLKFTFIGLLISLLVIAVLGLWIDYKTIAIVGLAVLSLIAGIAIIYVLLRET